MAALNAAAFWPSRPGPKRGWASLPKSTAPRVRFSFPWVSIKSSIARMRRSVGSLEDMDPESSTIASRFVLGVHAAALEAGAALEAATPSPANASRATLAAEVAFQAVLIDPSRVRSGQGVGGDARCGERARRASTDVRLLGQIAAPAGREPVEDHLDRRAPTAFELLSCHPHLVRELRHLPAGLEELLGARVTAGLDLEERSPRPRNRDAQHPAPAAACRDGHPAGQAGEGCA